MKYSTEFIKKMNVRDMAFLKFCLVAMGMMLGLCVPRKHRKVAFAAAIAVFIATYIPIMGKFLQGYLEE